MACLGCVAFNDETTLPYLSLVVEGERFAVVSGDGEVPGGAGVLGEIAGLFGGDGLDMESAFGVYAAAFGCSPSPLAVLPVGFDAAVEYMRGQLLLGQGSGSPVRQAVLDRVAAARRGLGVDTASVLDERLFDPDGGAESMVPAEVRERFLLAAGWEPYRFAVGRRDVLASEVLEWASGVGEAVGPEAVVPEAVVPVEPAVPPVLVPVPEAVVPAVSEAVVPAELVAVEPAEAVESVVEPVESVDAEGPGAGSEEEQ